MITHYSLDKVSCGGRVLGNARFCPLVKGRSISDVLSMTSAELLHAARPADSVEEFLFLKHLFSIQLALKALTGCAASGKDAACTIAYISHTPDGTEIRARLRVDLVTEKIKACDRVLSSFPA